MSVENNSLITDRQAEQDRVWMHAALAEAALAEAADEVPIGAVIVLEGQIIGRGHNTPISTTDPTAHAEVQAVRHARAADEELPAGRCNVIHNGRALSHVYGGR